MGGHHFSIQLGTWNFIMKYHYINFI
jgi:hypothetical protein